MQKKTKNMQVFLHAVKRIFRSRSIIIISDHKVDHVPLSGVMQALLFVGCFGFFSGVSYITGSYMAARSVIVEKDKKIVNASLEKGRINDEILVLKRDLERLNQNGNELTAFSKMIINRHNETTPLRNPALEITSTALADGSLFGQSTGKLLDRISFLENRVNEIATENDHLITAIRARTNNKINYLSDIISSTGLDPDRLERMASSEKESRKGTAHRAGVLAVNPVADESAKKEVPADRSNQGGPFIPYESASFNDDERLLLFDVDRLVALNDIIKQLPLAQPINDAQQTGPFGKRIDPINRRWAMHPGIDFAGPIGAKVFAANDGVVVNAGRRPAYGNMVDIEHKFGIVTRYAHLSKITVNVGDTVRKGQVIGIQGSTGRSTGPHLHYEVRINDRPVNPINFLNAGQYVLEN